MIPVNVITGFLGAGKTTLLRHILGDGRFGDAAVIVNEFGEIGLDHLLVEEVEEGVLLMENGCICCTVREDLRDTLRDLEDRASKGSIPPFSRVVIETTGLADPVPVVGTILNDPVIRNHFRLGNLVCVVDAVNGPEQMRSHKESLRQAVVSDRIVLTKTDMLPEGGADSVRERLSALVPNIPVSTAVQGEVDPGVLIGQDVGSDKTRLREVAEWLEGARDGNGHSRHGHAGTGAHGDVHSFPMEFGKPIDWVRFCLWLSCLLHAHGDRIIRVKGILNVTESDTPVVINGVQHLMHLPMHLASWPTEDRRSVVIFITEGIAKEAITGSFERFFGLPAEAGGGSGPG